MKINRLCFNSKAWQIGYASTQKHGEISSMILKCSICQHIYSSIQEAYSHSRLHTDPLYTSGKYSVTSCTKCTFSHENCNITKVHCEYTHGESKQPLHITHHRFEKPSDAVKQHNTVSTSRRKIF